MLSADPCFILTYVFIQCFLLTIILGMAHMLVEQEAKIAKLEAKEIEFKGFQEID